MPFLREDLLFAHYDWNEDSPLFNGDPTRRTFNRRNGFQVLFLINCCSAFLGTFSLAEGRVIEERIWNLLPLEIRNEIAVFHWIRSGFFDEWHSKMNKH